MLSEKYLYYFHCPKKVLCSILSFVFWIFPPLNIAVQSADSKQNAISKYVFQDSFQHIFGAMRKMHHTFWKKRPLVITCNSKTIELWKLYNHKAVMNSQLTSKATDLFLTFFACEKRSKNARAREIDREKWL